MQNQANDTARDMLLLEHIESDPDITQASLADSLGVAVGTVNWHLKRLVSKGYVKVKRAQRRKLRYIITPQGISLRARLTLEYVDRSMRLYRQTRRQVRDLLDELQEAGYQAVRIEVQGQSPDDIADICRLTCLERGVELLGEEDPGPALRVQGQRVLLEMEKVA